MITKETKKEEPDFDKEEIHPEIRREVSMEISMEGIVKWFPPDHRALNGLNLSISPGETVQILGYAGSGKSLLADILTGRTIPEEGRVCFRGQDYARMKPEERAHLRWKYMVLLRAHPGFLPALSMRENTALPLLLSGEAETCGTESGAGGHGSLRRGDCGPKNPGGIDPGRTLPLPAGQGFPAGAGTYPGRQLSGGAERTGRNTDPAAAAGASDADECNSGASWRSPGSCLPCRPDALSAERQTMGRTWTGGERL